MDYFRINGAQKLGGEIRVHGAKNSVLPILAATLLVRGKCVLHNCPQLSDVAHTLEILRHLGAQVKREGNTLMIDTESIKGCDIPLRLTGEMRSSVIFLGALAARQRRACLSLPGGCDIGARPIDLHIRGLQTLGYRTQIQDGQIDCLADGAHAAKVVLPFPSVGATQNMVLASVLLPGETTIINAAREPEIEDLCAFLNRCGADIRGAGEPVIKIEGVTALYSAEYTVMPDRIVAATFLTLSAASGCELYVSNVRHRHQMPLLPVLEQCGCKLYLRQNAIRIKPPKRLKRVRYIETRPYPGFPTDCQAPVTAMLSLARGISQIKETVFENRFRHIPYLNRFGADMTVQGDTVCIRGVSSLHGARVKCTDLRGGAAVVLAALCAEGISEIEEVYHLDRGYEAFENQLSLIGAQIKRMKYEEEGKGNTPQKGQRAESAEQ